VVGFNAPQLVYKPMVDFFQRHWVFICQVSVISLQQCLYINLCNQNFILQAPPFQKKTSHYLSLYIWLCQFVVYAPTWVFVSLIMGESGLFGQIFSFMYPVYLIYILERQVQYCVIYNKSRISEW
jgi:hypothetical protein